MEYKIKITGGGTAKEIIESLESVLNDLKEVEGKEEERAELDGAQWEDESLFTEIEIDE